MGRAVGMSHLGPLQGPRVAVEHPVPAVYPLRVPACQNSLRFL